MNIREIEELASDMAEAHQRCGTIKGMCELVLIGKPDADMAMLEAMARAICAREDLKK